jgi:hypothetical protein
MVQTIRSITQVGTHEPFNLQSARKQIPGHLPLFKFGFNTDLDAEEETIWDQGGNVPWPTSAFTAYIVSSDAADVGGGTGTNTVRVEGLDANYHAQSVVVTLDGLTPVAISGTWIRVNRAFVTLAGSGGTSAGIITVQNQAGTIIYASLALGNQTQMAVYTVPAGFTLYLDDINFTAALGLANKRVTASFVAREFGSNVFRTGFINVLQSSQVIAKFDYPLAFPEKTDMECRAFTDTINTTVGASFQGILIQNQGPL